MRHYGRGEYSILSAIPGAIFYIYLIDQLCVEFILRMRQGNLCTLFYKPLLYYPESNRY
jgi:hypothetical protein